MMNIFRKKADPALEDHGLNKPPKKQQAIVLVIDSDPKHNWAEIFNGCKDQNGNDIRVEQAAWEDVMLSAYSSNNSIYVDVRPSRQPIAGTNMNKFRTFGPTAVLIRNGPLQIDADYQNLLFGFKYAGLPSVNSLESIYNFRDRPWVFAELIRIRDRVGIDKFPLIEQTYYSGYREMMITPKYPIVVKVGHAHAGYGKVKLANHHDFEDIKSLVALHKDYSTAESYVEGAHDLRIQKIGNKYRAFKRTSMSGNWKTNTGTSILETIPMTDRFKLWADECGRIFGGLDIFAVDAIVDEKGQEQILEVNDTAIGLSPDFESEDNIDIRNLLLAKMGASKP